MPAIPFSKRFRARASAFRARAACCARRFCRVVRRRFRVRELGDGVPRRPLPAGRGASTTTSRARPPSCSRPTDDSSPSSGSSGERSSRSHDIPPLVRNAFVVTEDKRFYQHAGIDWIRVPGALLVDIKNRNFSEGFSTITMQLARNIFPERISRDKTLIRKLKEAKVARDIEERTRRTRFSSST